MNACKSFYGIDKEFFSKGCANTSEEIARQPSLWAMLGETLQERKNDATEFMEGLGDLSRIRVVFTGAGSSAFIGDALSVLIAKNTGLKTESIHSTDIVSAPESYLLADSPTLLVSFARSGNSPESIGAVKYARAVVKDLYELAIICDGESNLASITAQSPKSFTLVMPEGSNDNGFAMTGSVSCMMLAGYALFNLDKADDIIKDINLLANNTSDTSLGFTEAARKWAEKGFDRVVYLGSGFLKHIAHEASLKMMELTNGGVNGAFESAAGFRHGPKSVINDRTLTVHMISNNPFTAKYDIDLLNEVAFQQKNNMIIAICTEDTGCVPGDETIKIASGGYAVCGDICTGLEGLVFCQMLAMFKSLSLGITTDNPSPTGEVNRVVKGVTIYDY